MRTCREKTLCGDPLASASLRRAENQMGARSKRDRIFRIWSLTGEAGPDFPLLSDDVLVGVAKPGAAFMTKMPDELGYLLSTIHAAKQLGRDELSRLLADPWGFGKWVDEQGGSDRRGFRHMLLYLCFPESYERISSWRHKRRISERHAKTGYRHRTADPTTGPCSRPIECSCQYGKASKRSSRQPSSTSICLHFGSCGRAMIRR